MLRIFCAPRDNKNASAAAYELLAHAFRKEFGTSLPEIKKTSAGKPYFPLRSDVHFSISHAATHVLCALSDRPVGADIESPRNISDRVVRYFSSPEELSFFAPLELWVLKESYIKLIGGNLLMVKTLRFSIEDGKIILPDKSAAARLYRVSGCTAAISCYCDSISESIVLF